jgi:hypothetical protein
MASPSIPPRRRGLRPSALPLLLALLAAGLAPTLPWQPLRAEGDVGSSFGAGGQPWGRLGRAVALARQAAASRNGGDSAYRPSSCMQRIDGGNCLVEDGEAGFLFRIPGGPPGWQEAGQAPSRETVVRVSSDGRRVVQILYDGSPRPWNTRPKRRGGSWS